ncbi:hypothetical protein [Natrinema soli]|uniref:Uncharacterized protein n=1 Tax=Natrinema soli TaxID=1930624 RepID=A0ABD5SPW7_9EURY|nr:hypothetical protein [Natrinema soli]
MRRKIIPLLTVLAILLVAVGSTAAAGSTGTNIDSTAETDANTISADAGICLVGADSPCNDAPIIEPVDSDKLNGSESELTETDSDADDGDVGICLVGVDSPCNEAPNDGPADGNKSVETGQSNEEEQIWIPEDQNRDGEIDDRFVTSFMGMFADMFSFI